MPKIMSTICILIAFYCIAYFLRYMASINVQFSSKSHRESQSIFRNQFCFGLYRKANKSLSAKHSVTFIDQLGDSAIWKLLKSEQGINLRLTRVSSPRQTKHLLSLKCGSQRIRAPTTPCFLQRWSAYRIWQNQQLFSGDVAIILNCSLTVLWKHVKVSLTKPTVNQKGLPN